MSAHMHHSDWDARRYLGSARGLQHQADAPIARLGEVGATLTARAIDREARRAYARGVRAGVAAGTGLACAALLLSVVLAPIARPVLARLLEALS